MKLENFCIISLSFHFLSTPWEYTNTFEMMPLKRISHVGHKKNKCVGFS